MPLCSHAGDRGLGGIPACWIPWAVPRGVATGGPGQRSGSIFQPLEMVMDVHSECLPHPTRPQRRRGAKLEEKRRLTGKSSQAI